MKRIFLTLLAINIILSGNIYAQEEKKMAQAKKSLVVYYSKTGHTEKIAKDIASGLNADIEKIIDKKKRTGFFGFIFGGRDAMKKRLTDIEPVKKNPANYNLVILGTPVWAGNITPAVRTYIHMNKAKLKKTAFIISSGGAKPEKIIPCFEELLGKNNAVFISLTEKEFKNEKIYKEKIEKFIREINK